MWVDLGWSQAGYGVHLQLKEERVKGNRGRILTINDSQKIGAGYKHGMSFSLVLPITMFVCDAKVVFFTVSTGPYTFLVHFRKAVFPGHLFRWQ